WVVMPAGISSFYLKDSPPSESRPYDFDYSGNVNSPVLFAYKNTEAISFCHATGEITVAAYRPPTVDFTITNLN
ncbi:MAG: hypothetical protein CRN43_22695, partial [Candidatus Nephrothrix sp. EaCA]